MELLQGDTAASASGYGPLVDVIREPGEQSGFIALAAKGDAAQ